MKRSAPFLIVGIVALTTIIWGTLLYRNKRSAVRPEHVETAETGNTGTHILGNPSAKMTIQEYGDFQCPPCGTLAEPLNQMVREFQPDLRLVYRNFPLPVHAHAREAAVAAEAAGLQGKFWEMHDLLYREQGVWSKATNVQFLFNTYAGMLGLDVRRFASDSASESTNDLVKNDERRGQSINVTNTPTLFLNETVVEAKNLNPAALRSLIGAALNKNPKP